MLVRLNLSSRPPTVELRGADDFSGVRLQVVGEDVPAVAGVAFARYGRIIDRQTAWVSVAGLLELAEGAADDAWERGFEEMLARGTEEGWADAEHTELQVPVEWV